MDCLFGLDMLRRWAPLGCSSAHLGRRRRLPCHQLLLAGPCLASRLCAGEPSTPVTGRTCTRRPPFEAGPMVLLPRRWGCSIDLRSNCLRFGNLGDLELPFLAEHELPRSALFGRHSGGAAEQPPGAAPGARLASCAVLQPGIPRRPAPCALRHCIACSMQAGHAGCSALLKGPSCCRPRPGRGRGAAGSCKVRSRRRRRLPRPGCRSPGSCQRRHPAGSCRFSPCRCGQPCTGSCWASVAPATQHMAAAHCAAVSCSPDLYVLQAS